jgi:hypothetical protein
MIQPNLPKINPDNCHTILNHEGSSVSKLVKINPSIIPIFIFNQQFLIITRLKK